MAETILPLLLKYRISSIRNSKANMNEPVYGEAYLYLTSTFKKNTFMTLSSELQIHQIGYLEPSFLLNRLSVNWPGVICWLLAAWFWPVACRLLWKVKGTGPTQWPLSRDTPFGKHRQGAWKCLCLQPGKGVFLGQGRPGVIQMQPFSWGRKHLVRCESSVYSPWPYVTYVTYQKTYHAHSTEHGDWRGDGRWKESRIELALSSKAWQQICFWDWKFFTVYIPAARSRCLPSQLTVTNSSLRSSCSAYSTSGHKGHSFPTNTASSNRPHSHYLYARPSRSMWHGWLGRDRSEAGGESKGLSNQKLGVSIRARAPAPQEERKLLLNPKVGK